VKHWMAAMEARPRSSARWKRRCPPSEIEDPASLSDAEKARRASCSSTSGRRNPGRLGVNDAQVVMARESGPSS